MTAPTPADRERALQLLQDIEGSKLWPEPVVRLVLDSYRKVRAEARREALEEAAQAALAVYPCSCDEAYTSRKLTAPDCYRCNALKEAAAAIRALSEDR